MISNSFIENGRKKVKCIEKKKENRLKQMLLGRLNFREKLNVLTKM